MTAYHYLYILECSNNSYYIGYTTDMQRRWSEHCNGSPKCKYTRSFPPERIAVCWRFDDDKSEVLSLEYRLKQLSKAAKSALIESPQQLTAHTEISSFEVINPAALQQDSQINSQK